MSATRQEILDYLLETLTKLSQDWDFSEEIGPSSLLFTELGFDSLGAVVLGTTIQEHFQKAMPFAELLADIGEKQRDLSVSELVDFIDKHVNSSVEV